jgi:hypothetical protein
MTREEVLALFDRLNVLAKKAHLGPAMESVR